MQAFSRSGKGKERDSPLRLPGRNSDLLDLNLVGPMSDF